MKAYSNMAHDQFSSYIKPQLNMKSAKLLVLHLGHAEQTKHSYQGMLRSSKHKRNSTYGTGNYILPFQEHKVSSISFCGFTGPRPPQSHLVTGFPNTPWSNSISLLKSKRDTASPVFSF